METVVEPAMTPVALAPAPAGAAHDGVFSADFAAGAPESWRRRPISRIDVVKPETAYVVLTGRNAAEALIEAADLATETTILKHPFRSGAKAQAGVEF